MQEPTQEYIFQTAPTTVQDKPTQEPNTLSSSPDTTSTHQKHQHTNNTKLAPQSTPLGAKERNPGANEDLRSQVELREHAKTSNNIVRIAVLRL